MRRLIHPLVIFAAVLAAFWSVGGYGLINLDDYQYVVDKVPSYGLKWAFTWVGDAMWVPLTWLSYWLDWTLFGENWGAYHLHSVLVQALNGVILYFVLTSLARDLPRKWCLLAALLWAVHPLRVESVAWVASRKDVLSTFFFLLALWAWYAGERKALVLVSLVCLVLGGLAKASVMVFPAFVVACDFFVTRRAKPWWAYVAVTALSLGFAAEAAWAQKAGGALAVTEGIPMEYKVFNAAASLTVYLFNLVCPTSLAAQCQLKYPAPPRFSLVGFALICGVVWSLRAYLRDADRRNAFPKSELVAGIVIFFSALVPFLGLSGFGSHAFADRFTMLPSLGASVAFLWVARRVEADALGGFRRPRLLALGTLAVVALFCLTLRQVGYWRDEGTLFSRTLEVDGDDNLLAHDEVVMHHYERGHDFAKVYAHAKSMMSGPEWAQKRVAHAAPILIEAAFETGHDKEARELFYWHMRWGRVVVSELRRENPAIGQMDTMQVADAILSAYDGDLKSARRVLAELEKDNPNRFLVKNLAVVIARRSGDRRAYEKAWREAYAPDGESFIHNRWALGPCPK